MGAESVVREIKRHTRKKYSAEEKIRIILEKLSANRLVSPDNFAVIYAGLGDKEKAMEYLERAVGQRSPKVLFLKVDPYWDSFRDDSRFIDLMKEIGLVE